MRDVMDFRLLPQLRGIPQIFPYQGSKRYLSNAIIPLIPVGTKTLIEPFCGSAAVSVAARYAGKVHKSIIADSNIPLIDLWNAIIANPVGLSDEYEQMWNDQLPDPKAYFLKVRDSFNNEPSAPCLLYLLNRIVKGAVRYSSDGRFNQSADNRRLGARPAVVSERLCRVSKVMIGTETIAGDYMEAVRRATPEDVIYMDPPYQGTSNNADHRYVANLSKERYEEDLAWMNERGLSYLVSYDRADFSDKYGLPLADSLNLTHLHLRAGRSAQATLLGRKEQTVESLYLSAALVDRLGGKTVISKLLNPDAHQQGALL